MGKRMCTVNGVDMSSNWVSLTGLRPSGPGSIGQGTLVIEQVGGGYTIRNKMLVKVWEAFDDAGAGVADHGRWLIGFVDGRKTGAAANIKRWILKVVDCNILLKVLQIDAQDAAAVTIPAGSFTSQILALTQAMQRQGHPSVAIEIDATSFVASLVGTTMPAYVCKGKTYGQALFEICENARLQAPSPIYPQFYIGMDYATFGAGATVGDPVLHVYDAGLFPSPSRVFSDTPTGSQRYRYGTISRDLESTGLFSRGQSQYGPAGGGGVVTYEDTTSQGLYPNLFVNHGATGNSGYWQAPLKKDTASLNSTDALARLTADIQDVRFPREVYQHSTDVMVMPGEVVTEIDSLEDGLGAGVNYRVASSSIDVTRDTDPEVTIQLASRRLELLEKNSGSLAAPAEGDNTPPLAPTALTLDPPVWDDLAGEWVLYLYWVNSASRDVAIHTVREAQAPEQWILANEGEIFVRRAPSTAYYFTVTATDTAGHESGPSNAVAGTTGAAPAVSPPASFTLTSNVYNYVTGLAELTYTIGASPDPSIVNYKIQQEEGIVGRTYLTAGLLVFLITVAPGTLIKDARVYAINSRGVQSVATPSEAGLADYTAASPSYERQLTNPGFEIVDPNDSTKPYKWIRATSGVPGATMTRDTAQMHEGVASLKLHTTTAGQKARAESVLIPLSSGATFEIRAWARASLSNTDNLRVSYNEYDASFALITPYGHSLRTVGPAANTWYAHAWQYTPSASARYIQVVLENDANVGSKPAVDLWLDDIQVINLITDAEVKPQSLTSASLANDSVGAAQIAAGSVGESELEVVSGMLAKSWLLPKISTTTKGRLSAVVEQAGTSFPGSPTTNDFFYRTDLGLLCRYDGTRWLSELVLLPMHNYLGTPPYSTTTEALAGSVPGGFSGFIVQRWDLGFFIGSGNDVNNYWTVRLRRLTAGISVDTIKDLSTQSLSNNVWQKLVGSSGFTNNPLNASDIWAQVYVTPTNAPGAIYIQSQVTGRLVVT